MKKIPLFDSKGAKKGDITLPKEIFETEISEGLIHEALLRQQGNARISTAAIKTKSDVRGGGRKPWRQKGTGRARQGSIRSAQWRGGGVIFGPNVDRNYSKLMPKKMRRKALFSVLSSCAANMIALESFDEKTPKTKALHELLGKMGCVGKILIVEPGRNEILEKSAKNIPGVKTIFAQYLNIADILSAKHIVFLKEAIDKTQTIFAPKK